MLGGYSAVSGLAEAQTWKTLTMTGALRVSSAHLRTFLSAYPTLATSFWRWAAAERIESLLQAGGYIAEGQAETMDWLLSSTIEILAPNTTRLLQETACVLLFGTIRDDEGRTFSAPMLVKAEIVSTESAAVVYLYSLLAENDGLRGIIS
jgi:hypothetical protein